MIPLIKSISMPIIRSFYGSDITEKNRRLVFSLFIYEKVGVKAAFITRTHIAYIYSLTLSLLVILDSNRSTRHRLRPIRIALPLLNLYIPQLRRLRLRLLFFRLLFGPLITNSSTL